MSYSDPPPPSGPFGGQPPYGGDQPYGAGQPGQPAKTSGKATAAMITGLVGALTLCCGFFVVSSIAAVVLGFLARRDIAASGGTLKGDGQALTGIIAGGLGIALFVVSILLVLTGVVDYNFDYSTS
ncbi:DUF4190 domain-containing protein [Nocardioides sp. SOB77]|uniref:DUF4190 domain-containing protein n=1 Tax=Nocardioides oceani TaxID=3058369 RepID=A0ABT8FF70_9ACTN|nr:DUF4190 domain-containing protein [Nocardioides oceani]MDN4173072.1 DUF4190 domain-containing protein [Nocardioides oceani]